ncbi:hypothetical protein AX769_18055 [Frondihabitans sp. PAMC 28766]|uniref:glycosyltransferase family 2 protein n=1 Tax=Frondihabitans sp. PAMC 28766 TaxID=1795630 RepID=UPI00078B3C36|nr:glycosyltransferase family 2 protein [Frondihabitans sp. PAMC 28766]AMM21703.1 hypothetical protein AX769_18055 [Frondihabitans sp. PAMC 28766]
MKLAVTAMVRDEADIIRQWVDYHVAQGVDVILVTDNGSIDGTREILQSYADRGLVDLRDEPVQMKQQGQLVTGMAREASSRYGADWVINADADEFLMPVDRSLRLRDVFERLDPALAAFTVPIVNMVGRIARSGAGIDRLVWRDERTNDELQQRGVLAQPTPNAIHVGSPDVTVVQGNHLVSIGSQGTPPPTLALEVIHLPWRSWKQLDNKVEISGRAYDANPDLAPSPNHHGMLDYRRHHDGTLFFYYALRMVTDDEAEAGPFRLDRSLPDFFDSLEHEGAPYPADHPYAVDAGKAASRAGEIILSRDRELRRERDERRVEAAGAQQRVLELERHTRGLEAENARITAELDATHARKVVRLADALGSAARRGRR